MVGELFTFENEAFAHTPSLVTHPQLCILVYKWSYGSLDGGLPQTSLRPSEVGRQVPHIAAAGAEVHLENLGGDFVVLGYALEHSVRGHR